jgi:hypothetical protein
MGVLTNAVGTLGRIFGISAIEAAIGFSRSAALRGNEVTKKLNAKFVKP